MHHSLARAHGGATGVLDRVVRALNPSAARGSGWRYQPGWYHGDRFRPQRTEAAVFVMKGVYLVYLVYLVFLVYML